MKKTCITVVLMCISSIIYAQYFTISGTIEDEGTGEQLVGANIYEESSLTGTVTNFYGFYSIKLPKGKIRLVYSYVGYESKVMELDLQEDITINLKLLQDLKIDEVTITDKSPTATVRSTQMSVAEIPMIQVKQLPVLFGETDVIKTIQLLPGVQSGTEGLSGMYVRGGGASENLILLDGVPVYNVSHLFGFFSVFNADAINSFNLYKGGFPARYGSRLSSVLDIKMKEGNMNEYKGNVSIGLISSKFTFEGPIIKNKASFIVSARRTYIDALLRPVQKIISSSAGESYDIKAGYYFYDLNAKINYKFSDKSRLYYSIYTGKDKAYAYYKDKYSDFEFATEYEDDMQFYWGNITSALRWNYIISHNLFCNVSATFSKYNLTLSNEYYDYRSNVTDEGTTTTESNYFLSYSSGINDLAAKVDFDFIPSPNHYIRFGLSHTYHTFRPAVTIEQEETKGEEVSQPIDIKVGDDPNYAHETSLYFEDEIKITRRLKTNIGIHTSSFLVENNQYFSFEPRVSARFLVNDKLSIKAAFSEMQQYVHLLTNSGVSLPTDMWVPVTDTIKPMQSWQLATGFAYNMSHGFALTIEGYYKKLSNLIAYKDGASYFDETGGWESKVEIGQGESYGAEIMLQRQEGNFKGWMAYTLSWANRQFDNISYGKEFPFKYDRRHDFSVALTYSLKKKYDFGVSWVYGSGYPFTFGSRQYHPFYNYITNNSQSSNYYGGNYQELNEYVEHRNNYRMPAYHRLDVSVTRNKIKGKTNRALSLGIYNAYNRKNPFFVYKSEYDLFDLWSQGPTKPKMYQLSLFPMIPFIKYSVSF